jgi:hypothetical protein
LHSVHKIGGVWYAIIEDVVLQLLTQPNLQRLGLRRVPCPTPTTLSSAVPWTMSSASRVLPLSGEPSLSHNRMMLRKLFQFEILCKGLPAMDFQSTRLHLHFASTKSSTFIRLASRQLKINVGRRGTNQLHLLERYLDIVVKHTTEIPPPTALVEGTAPVCLSRRCVIKMNYFKL